jgi:hypothetical protein
MESWEHLVVVLTVDLDSNPGAMEYLAGMYPGWIPPVYWPESLTPDLNAYGQEGWELLSLQPVGLAEDGKVAPDASANNYLAVFRRQLPAAG